MKRLGFDLECDVHLRLAPIRNSFEDGMLVLKHYWGKPIQFHAATVVDADTDEVWNVSDPEHLLQVLSRADELVGFNSLFHDLPTLAWLVGEDRVFGLLQRPHHDMMCFGGPRRGFEDTVPTMSPKNFGELEAAFTQQCTAETANVGDEFKRHHLIRSGVHARLALALFAFIGERWTAVTPS